MNYIKLNTILNGNVLDELKSIPDNSIDTCVTSPPYWGLRDYGTNPQVWGGDSDCKHEWVDQMDIRGVGTHSDFCNLCGAWKGEYGLEPTPQLYVEHTVMIFREIKRVLKDSGTLWLNLGDSYVGTGSKGEHKDPKNADGRNGQSVAVNNKVNGLKQKDLVGIPWRVAFALQDDGWYLRSDIIWNKPNCLSGGTILYARTQKGDAPIPLKDLVRLKPESVQLWNGQKWTQVLAWTENTDSDNKIEIEFRNGQRVGCTGDHLWPTRRGNVKASDLRIGDIVQTCTLPEPENVVSPSSLDDELIGWFIGLYLAEGSRSSDCIQISSHIKELDRYEKLKVIAQNYHGTCEKYIGDGNGMTVNLHGKILNSIVDTYIGGQTAKDKHIASSCWKRSNKFLKSILEGYLSGDGSKDEANNRWRIGFTRNYYLESDLRTLCARLGIKSTIKLSNSKIKDKSYPSFKGEIRFDASNHRNTKESGEIVRIGKSRGRKFWDVTVSDEPNLFALASGILTHNCMPESVKDRPTRSHEYIFLLSKNRKYYYDNESIKEMVSDATIGRMKRGVSNSHKNINGAPGQTPHSMNRPRDNDKNRESSMRRNKRTVWTVTTKPFKEAHFATYPPDLIEPCVLAGCPQDGVVLDPFFGAGTTGLVAMNHNRSFVGIEINPEYVEIAKKRLGLSV